MLVDLELAFLLVQPHLIEDRLHHVQFCLPLMREDRDGHLPQLPPSEHENLDVLERSQEQRPSLVFVFLGPSSPRAEHVLLELPGGQMNAESAVWGRLML